MNFAVPQNEDDMLLEEIDLLESLKRDKGALSKEYEERLCRLYRVLELLTNPLEE